MAYERALGVIVICLAAGCGGKVLGEGSLGFAFDSGLRAPDGSIVGPGRPGPGQRDSSVLGPGSDSGPTTFDGGVIIGPFDASFPPPFYDGSVGPNCPPSGEVLQLGSRCYFGGECNVTLDVCHDGSVVESPAFCLRGVVSLPPGVGFGCAVTPDSGLPPQDGGILPVDAGPPSTSIACGTTTCDSTTQDCCVSFQRGAGTSCVAHGTCSGIPLTCTGSANCSGGDVCCASLGGGGASCQPTCAGTGGFGGSFQLCNSDSDCPSGDHCRMSPFGVGICRAPGGGGSDGGRGGGGPGH